MKKQQQAASFVIPALLGLTVTQAQKFRLWKNRYNVNYMDKTVKPATTFFRYVNGTWLDNTEIPSDRTRWEVLMN
jgi:endothelin-converting enzyme/putative endopeptidase